MNPDPVISVCIPAYRRTEFLQRLLDSLAIQTYAGFEIVLTDDSPDNSVATLVQAHILGKKICYFRNPEALGTPENWNEGLRQAKGKWIKIMHDDDWFTGPDSLARFAEAALSGNASFYFSAYQNVTPDGKKEQPFNPGNFAGQLKATPEVLLASNRIGPPSVVMYRAQPEMRFDRRMKWLVDIDFYLRYLKKYPPAEYLAETLVNIGISASQVTQSSFGNPAVEIPERMLLGEKLGFSSLGNLTVFDSWWRFVRNMGIRSEKDLAVTGSATPVPDFLCSMIRFQKRFPRSLLRAGLVSRCLMTAQYLMYRLKNSKST